METQKTGKITKTASLSLFDLDLISSALEKIAPVVLASGNVQLMIAFQAVKKIMKNKKEELETPDPFDMMNDDPVGFGSGYYDEYGY